MTTQKSMGGIPLPSFLSGKPAPGSAPPPAVDNKGPEPTPGGPRNLSQHKHRIMEALGNEWRIVPVLLSLAIIWAFFESRNSVFLSARNLSNLAGQIVTIGLIGVGMVIVLLVAEIDLSVAALSAISGAVAGVLVVNHNWPVVLAVAVTLLIGALYGLIQGTVVTLFRVPSFIITLAGSLVLGGVLLVILPAQSGLVSLAGTSLQGLAADDLPAWLSYALAVAAAVVVLGLQWHNSAGRARHGLPARYGRAYALSAVVLLLGLGLAALFNSYQGVPWEVMIFIAVLALFAYVTSQTRFGTYLYAIGGNAEAARRTGIRVRHVKVAAFVIIGVLAALAGIIAASQVLGVSPSSNDSTLLLEAVAAAVIGGTSLFGGRGTVWAALIGALVIGSIDNGMYLINAATQTRLIVEGLVLVLAVVLDSVIAGSSRT